MRRRTILLFVVIAAALGVATSSTVALALEQQPNDSSSTTPTTTTQQSPQNSATITSSSSSGVQPYSVIGGVTSAWGYNAIGQLGNNSTTNSSVPVQVSNLNASDVKNVSGGGLFSLALKNDGTVWAWGDNTYGQLGDGTSSTVKHSSTPVQVKDKDDPSGYLHASAISAGGQHSLALKSDGTVKAWGNNFRGQLGNGTTTTSGCYCVDTPVQVSNLSGVIKSISAGRYHSLAN